MGFIERFRRKTRPGIRLPMEVIPEQLIIRTGEKLLNDLRSGFKYEHSDEIYNLEELDKFEEFGSEGDHKKDLQIVAEGLKVVIKNGDKYYKVNVNNSHKSVWDHEEFSTLFVDEYGDSDLSGSSRRRVYVNPNSTLSFIDSGGKELDFLNILMNAKVDPIATQKLFRTEQERIERLNLKHFVVYYWPGH